MPISKREVWPRRFREDPRGLGARHFVLLREKRNPYKPGSPEHAAYEKAFDEVERWDTKSGVPLRGKEQERVEENRRRYDARARRQKRWEERGR